jgi:hypothetical protein
MTNPGPCVEISTYVPGEKYRHVRIERPGTTPVLVACASQAEFESVLHRERPDVDPNDAEQIHWADHPGTWSHS